MSNLSDVFKYISHFRHAGHQVGRKVGDMLEVLTYSALARDKEIKSRLNVEPKLFGFSGAGHKVEFVIRDEQAFDDGGMPKIINGGSVEDPGEVLAFVECKRVGVEQTINTSFKKSFDVHSDRKHYAIPFEEALKVSFAPRGGGRHVYSVVFDANQQITITKDEDDDFLFSEEIAENHRIIFALNDDGSSTVYGNANSLRDFPGTLKNCRILEIHSFQEGNVIAVLNDCLSGPQTPEKAKQSSFVALDVRKKRFGSFDRRIPEAEMLSVLVMTEFSHWEEKSQNMVKACIDKNLVVPDNIIVEAFVAFEEEFGADFYEYVTKEMFDRNERVNRISNNIVNKYGGKIFYDIETGNFEKFIIDNNAVKLIS